MRILKKSKTYNVIAVFTVLSALQPLAMDLLTQFSLSQKWVTLVNFVMLGVLAYLRSITTGPVRGSSND